MVECLFYFLSKWANHLSLGYPTQFFVTLKGINHFQNFYNLNKYFELILPFDPADEIREDFEIEKLLLDAAGPKFSIYFNYCLSTITV